MCGGRCISSTFPRTPGRIVALGDAAFIAQYQQACLVRFRGNRGARMQLDPEGNETAALDQLLPDLRGLHVLEVGCGDGRLTCRYAERAASVLAIDPDPAAIATFR